MKETVELARAARVSVVVPVYSNAATLAPLRDRLCAALGVSLLEIVFVDDACPRGSGAALDALAEKDPLVVVLHHASNRGQNEAVLSGLARARGDVVVVMDADLQDPPEDVPSLLARLDADSALDVVFAARAGRYQGALRLLTGKLYRAWIAALTGLPRGATLFLAMRRGVAQRLTTQREGRPYVVPMIGFARARVTSVPVERARRSEGTSAYLGLARLRVGLRTTAVILRWRFASILLLITFAAAAAFLAFVRLDPGDEVWFLQVAKRVAEGDVLYRDVFFGATPVSMWLTSAAVFLFGADVAIVKALAILIFLATAWLAVRVALRLGAPRSARWMLPCLLLALAPPSLVGPGSLYSPLAFAFLLFTVDRFFAARDSGRARAFVAVGVAAGLAFATKQNVGVLTIGALGVLLLIATQGSLAVRLRRCVLAAMGAIAIAVATVIPIVVSGGFEAFADQVFLNKGRYLDVAGVDYLRGIQWHLHNIKEMTTTLERVAAWGHLGGVLLAPLALLAAALGLVLTRSDARRRIVNAALLLVVTLVAAAFPRADLFHVLAALPAIGIALFVVLGNVALAPAHAQSPRPRHALVFFSGTVVVLVLATQLAVPAARIARGELVPSRTTHLRGALVAPSFAKELLDMAAALRASAQGGPLLVLTGNAALRYVVGGLRNPTPYDYPLVTAFGLHGEAETIERLRRGELPRVCLMLRPEDPLTPTALYEYVTEELRLVGGVPGCHLFAFPKAPPGKETWRVVVDVTSPRATGLKLSFDDGNGFRAPNTFPAGLVEGRQKVIRFLDTPRLAQLRLEPCTGPGCAVVVHSLFAERIDKAGARRRILLDEPVHWRAGPATRFVRSGGDWLVGSPIGAPSMIAEIAR